MLSESRCCRYSPFILRVSLAWVEVVAGDIAFSETAIMVIATTGVTPLALRRARYRQNQNVLPPSWPSRAAAPRVLVIESDDHDAVIVVFALP